MPILVILIIISLALYIYYKTKYFRTNLQMHKKWISSKSTIALGTFITLFGVNQIFLYHTIITYIIAAIFILLGVINILGGYRAYKHFLPLTINELKKTT